ncbi:hypothetical protein EON67_04560, partial [archaeon]
MQPCAWPCTAWRARARVLCAAMHVVQESAPAFRVTSRVELNPESGKLETVTLTPQVCAVRTRVTRRARACA